jgi:hypothetical protein
MSRDSWWTIIKWRFFKTDSILERFVGCSDSLFRLGIDKWFPEGLWSKIGGDILQACQISVANLINIDEVAILSLWVADRTSTAFQSIHIHGQIEFGGKPILFVGDLLRSYPWSPISWCLPSIGQLHVSLIGPQFETFGCNSQWELRILCGQALCSLLSMVKFMVFRIGWHSGNALYWQSPRSSQLFWFSSVSVWLPLVPCFSILSRLIPRTNSWIKSFSISKSAEVNLLISSGLGLPVLNRPINVKLPLVVLIPTYRLHQENWYPGDTFKWYLIHLIRLV